MLNKILGFEYTESKYRKQYASLRKILAHNNHKSQSNNDYIKQLKKETENLRKERIKMQTANTERQRIDRSLARQEMYYEHVGSICNTLPLPTFSPLNDDFIHNDKEYLLCISDIHYGANFTSENNTYSTEIAKDRFDLILKTNAGI